MYKHCAKVNFSYLEEHTEEIVEEKTGMFKKEVKKVANKELNKNL